jgi:hypothetical protein
MDAAATVAVSALVVALTQLLKWALIPDRYGPIAVLVLSAMGISVWVFSESTFQRTEVFEYVVGWVNVALAAAGIFGFTRAAAEGVVRAMPPPHGGAGSSPTTVEIPNPK